VVQLLSSEGGLWGLKNRGWKGKARSEIEKLKRGGGVAENKENILIGQYS